MVKTVKKKSKTELEHEQYLKFQHFIFRLIKYELWANTLNRGVEQKFITMNGNV